MGPSLDTNLRTFRPIIRLIPASLAACYAGYETISVLSEAWNLAPVDVPVGILDIAYLNQWFLVRVIVAMVMPC